MNADDLYWDRKDLMTEEEKEDLNHDRSTEVVPTFTPNIRGWILDEEMERAIPDADDRAEFEERSPALGVTYALLEEIRGHYPRLLPVQQRRMFRMFRSHMLRSLISCNGASTVDDLLNILQNEMESGIPAPIPDWYKFSTVTMGPRKIGYVACQNRGCFQTETVQTSFNRCSKCKIVYYCSADCQRCDWKARHKYVCKDAISQRAQVKQAGKFFQNFSDICLAGTSDAARSGDFATMVQAAATDPGVKARRKHLKKEKKRSRKK